jgi:O-antigen ligase
MDWLRRYWIYVLIFCLPFERIPSYDLTIGGATVTLRASHLVAALALLLLGFQAFRKIPWLAPRQPYFWLAAYLAVAVAGMAGALNPKRTLVALAATTLVIATSVLVSAYTKRLNWYLALKVMTVAAMIACAFGVYQFFGDMFGLPRDLTGLKEIYTKQVFGFPRIQSTGLEPLYFANFLLIPFLITSALTMAGKLRSKWWLVSLFVLAYAITLTLSRGAMYGALAGLVLLLVAVGRRNWAKSSLVMLAVIFGILATLGSIYVGSQKDKQGGASVAKYTKQSTKLTSPPGSADSDRAVNRKLAVAAFQERPILGYGLGNFGAYAKQARPDLYGKTNGEVTVNNEYFEVMAETGALGLASLAGFVATLLLGAVRAWKRLTDEMRVWLVGLLAVLIAFGVQYYAFSTLYVMHIWVVLGLLMGLVSSKPERTKT